MKRALTLFAALAAVVTLRAQAPAEGSEYSSDQLDQLTAPIALYPDPLVALILPAAAAPDDLTTAATYVANGGDPSAIDSQSWDPSVKGLAHYPDVLKWMSDNIDWTRALGAAFAMQPADVMKSVQSLRAKAKAAGTLTDTPQQQVEMDGDDIRIIPAQPNTIYAPEYDPDAVYDVPEGEAPPEIVFDAGYPVGAWLGFECDWDDFAVYVAPWHPGWAYRRDWADPHFAGRRWQPDPRTGHSLVRSYYRPGDRAPAPRMIAGARPGPARPAGKAMQPSPRLPARDFRGYAANPPSPSTPAPKSSMFSGYKRGTQARDNSTRGRTSRQAPVRSAPSRGAPARSAAPSNRDRH